MKLSTTINSLAGLSVNIDLSMGNVIPFETFGDTGTGPTLLGEVENRSISRTPKLLLDSDKYTLITSTVDAHGTNTDIYYSIDNKFIFAMPNLDYLSFGSKMYSGVSVNVRYNPIGLTNLGLKGYISGTASSDLERVIRFDSVPDLTGSTKTLLIPTSRLNENMATGMMYGDGTQYVETEHIKPIDIYTIPQGNTIMSGLPVLVNYMTHKNSFDVLATVDAGDVPVFFRL